MKKEDYKIHIIDAGISTNASAESFNAKIIKAFRAQFRGLRNVDFFLFRLSTIFA